VALVVQAFRSLGLPASIERHLHIKQRDRRYDEATMVESFVVLNALGGECLEDFTHLREDGGLKEILGHEIPIYCSPGQMGRSTPSSRGGAYLKSTPSFFSTRSFACSTERTPRLFLAEP
jgi:hypothetical protein